MHRRIISALLLAIGLSFVVVPAASAGTMETAAAQQTAAAAQITYGNVRNGGQKIVWTDEVAILPGGTSRGAGDADANYLSIPPNYVLYVWQIAYRSDGTKFWAWKGSYAFAGYLPLGNTSYYVQLGVGGLG